MNKKYFYISNLWWLIWKYKWYICGFEIYDGIQKSGFERPQNVAGK